MRPPIAEPENDEDEKAPGRQADPELLAMGRTLRILMALDEPARGRVVAWLHDRFWVKVPPF